MAICTTSFVSLITFQIILISNCVVYGLKCPILSPTHARKKDPVMPLLIKKYGV